MKNNIFYFIEVFCELISVRACLRDDLNNLDLATSLGVRPRSSVKEASAPLSSSTVVTEAWPWTADTWRGVAPANPRWLTLAPPTSMRVITTLGFPWRHAVCIAVKLRPSSASDRRERSGGGSWDEVGRVIERFRLGNVKRYCIKLIHRNLFYNVLVLETTFVTLSRNSVLFRHGYRWRASRG